MYSPPRAGLTRRRVLTLAAGAAVTRAARAAAGPRRLEMPRTLEAAVASMETLISPEAIDKIASLAEALQFEYRWGVGHIRRERWGEPWSYEQAGSVVGALAAECAAAGFATNELNDYLISTIAWRRRGRTLDIAAQLAPFREARRRREEQQAKREAESKRTGKMIIRRGYLEILDLVYFARGSVKALPGQEELVDAIAKTLVGSPEMLHLEVQAHAAPGEARPSDLSRERALAVLEDLVRLGVPTERLTAHGLGTRFPNREPAKTPKPYARDARSRAEIAILRRVTYD
jgi:outer membrane protein OmpA-like peptidoglycan-associated protein